MDCPAAGCDRSVTRPQSYRGMVTKLMNSAEEATSGDGPAPGSSDGSLKVNKASKQHTRWSGIFSNSSMKVSRGGATSSEACGAVRTQSWSVRRRAFGLNICEPRDQVY